MRAKFFVVRKIKSIDKVPRNVGLMTRDKVRYGMRCAKKDSCEKREKERKREKKSEKERKRADKREKISNSFVFFSSEFFVLSRLSLSALSLTLYAKNRHRRKVEKKKRSTKYGRRSSFSQQRRDL